MKNSAIIPATLYAAGAKPGDKFSCEWVGIDLLPEYTVESTDREAIRNARIIKTTVGREFYFHRDSEAMIRPITT